MDELQQTLASYREQYPDSQDPMDFMVTFGADGVLGILKEAEGREVIFEEDLDGGDDIAEYHFK